MLTTYQPACNEDAERIFDMSKALIDAYEDLASIDYDRVLAWMRRKIAGCIGEYQRVLVDGQLAGFFWFHPDGERMELDDLYILPEHRGKGVGTAVVEHCLRSTHKPVYLYVFIKNEGAVRLYRRLGFEVVETVGHTRYIMQRN